MASSGYYLKLDRFEGPLDLLLHLIKVHEIDVFNVDIFLLSTQYIKYLRTIEYRDLGDAGDFLEMAATLIEIKSRSLLPVESVEATEDDPEEDPKLRLEERLIEYETFRNVAEHFRGMPQLGVDIQLSSEWQRLSPLYEDVEAPLKGDAASIVILFEQILREFADRKPTVKVEAVTHRVGVEETIQKLENLLETVKFALFQGFYKKFSSRYDLVVHFLALLEMVRWGRAKV